MKTRVIIAGSRGFNDYALLKRKLNELLDFDDDITIISGTANGADSLGEKFAYEYDLTLVKMPANWAVHGKGAGYIRNEQMAAYASRQNGKLIAFWDGESKGTVHMIKLARKYNLEVKVIFYKEEKNG